MPRLYEMLRLHQMEAYSVTTTALKEDYTLPTAPANHVALYFTLTEEEHATFDEIGYASLTGALRAPCYDKINLFNTRAEALVYFFCCQCLCMGFDTAREPVRRLKEAAQ
ncbi:unnamed protein product [Effrenium voratum]|uniref:Uncharacterized protein n=1 Tax=Effrenium voratum TaxID=2562239 RepID=A0AA36J7X1_9DINO|nr:unnamed protein product [Effrenium voratum]CAJ1441548.1 unnamed protein product [Effrenium voratum]